MYSSKETTNCLLLNFLNLAYDPEFGAFVTA
jgi:hypothetical protein